MLNESPHPVEREHAVTLGLWGWICLLSRAIGITFSLLFKLIKAALGGPKNGHPLYKYIAYEGMRDYQYGLSAVGIQNILPSTKWMCLRFAKKSRLAHATIHLRDGSTAIKIGPSKPSKVLVLFHGGGYMAPALSEHMHFACCFAKTLPEGVSLYVLQYALASETANHYPRQLQQATALLEYLLNSENIPPEAITLVGDSAGGHLAVSLLLHLAHPNPRVLPLSLDRRRLAGAALISPWIITPPGSSEDGIVKDNEVKDVLHGAALSYWAANFLGLAKGEGATSEGPVDAWSCPLTAPKDRWADLPVDDILVTYGENEVLRDSASKFATVLQAKHAGTTATGYPDELHAHMIINRFLHINEECKSEEQFRAWLGARMTASTSK